MKTYFPGLNTLRFYAALSVVLAHFVAPVTWFNDIESFNWRFRGIFMEGNTAVTLFFVLSGFLILGLLIREKDTTGTVSVRRFYIRRVFRILPLYYLTVIAGAIIVVLTWNVSSRDSHLEASNPAIWLTLIFFVYNFMRSMALPLTHLWSLNIEEQFYLFAPHAIRLVRTIPAALIGFVGLKFAAQAVCWFAYQATGRGIFSLMLTFSGQMRFEAMALGGLGAYLVYKQHPLLRYIFHPVTQIASAVGFIVIALSDVPSLFLADYAVAFVFMVFIVNTAAAPHCFYRVETPLLRRLGDLSYSIYMAHVPIFWLLYAGGARGIVYQTVGIAFTLGAAFLLHHSFEVPFMRLRERFNPSLIPTPDVQTGPNRIRDVFPNPFRAHYTLNLPHFLSLVMKPMDSCLSTDWRRYETVECSFSGIDQCDRRYRHSGVRARERTVTGRSQLHGGNRRCIGFDRCIL